VARAFKPVAELAVVEDAPHVRADSGPPSVLSEIPKAGYCATHDGPRSSVAARGICRHLGTVAQGPTFHGIGLSERSNCRHAR
jgi:hypothetical protein